MYTAADINSKISLYTINMEVIVAKQAGFCFGVERATKIAFEAAESSEDEVYTLGDLIHNPQVVESLEAYGVRSVPETDNIAEGSNVIIRSHGLPPEVVNKLKEQGFEIIDATCPIVKKVQSDVDRLSKEGYTVVIIGDREHPEVISIAGHAGENPYIVNSVEEAREVVTTNKMGVVMQTTLILDDCREITMALLERTKELRVFNTLCGTTYKRQQGTRELAAIVDVMLVVGGRNSSNTNKLAKICKPVCERTYHIEVAAEIRPEWFDGAERVGITAGASTPDWIIDEVVARIGEIG
jgi:4-hydroxy-3-methylbut-2-enyl diphosphate reductase